MDRLTYEVESEVEKTHWWFSGRRKLIGRVVNELGVPQDARILDIGTSTGTNLRLLRELGFQHFEGLDSSPYSMQFCMEKGLGKVNIGDVCAIPFPDDTFDLVLATDIIEHVENDCLALSEICRVLKPGAKVIITVPAFESLWGLQDVVAHHKRRYRQEEILSRIMVAGLRPGARFYFNYILFLPILAARRLIKMFDVKLESENQLNNHVINAALTKVFEFDVWSSPILRPPFGVSFFAVAHKAETRDANS